VGTASSGSNCLISRKSLTMVYWIRKIRLTLRLHAWRTPLFSGSRKKKRFQGRLRYLTFQLGAGRNPGHADEVPKGASRITFATRAPRGKCESVLRPSCGCDSPCLEVDHGTWVFVGSSHSDPWRNRAREFVSSSGAAVRCQREHGGTAGAADGDDRFAGAGATRPSARRR
jgi:hypothetical protein